MSVTSRGEQNQFASSIKMNLLREWLPCVHRGFFWGEGEGSSGGGGGGGGISCYLMDGVLVHNLGRYL